MPVTDREKAIEMLRNSREFLLVVFDDKGAVQNATNASTNELLVAEKIVDALATQKLFRLGEKEGLG